MQSILMNMESVLLNHLFAFPFRFYAFQKWIGSTESFSLNFGLLWLPKILLEKMNNKRKELNKQWWLQSLLLQTLIYPILFVFFQCFKEQTEIQSTISNIYKQSGILGFYKGVVFHLLYEVFVLGGNWIKNNFDTRGLGHLMFLILQIPFLCFFEYQTMRVATGASLTNSFLSVICYLTAYVLEKAFEFKNSWNIFGNSKFIGG